MEYQASGLHEKATSALENACKLFRELGRTAKAAGCQETIKNYKAAASKMTPVLALIA